MENVLLFFIDGLGIGTRGPQNPFDDLDDVAPLAIEGLLLELLAGVTRQTSHSENGNAKWLSRARDFVHDRFQESISLAEVAEFAEVHPVSLARAFRKTYHCTVGDYVRRLRIESACQKLSSSYIRMPTMEQPHSSGSFS